MSTQLNNVTIVVRSVDERTTEICKKLLREEVTNECVFEINETPFSNAIKKSFEIGLQNNKKWTLCIDADVLIYPGAINKLIDIGEKTDEKVVEVQGLIADKFFFVKRPAGNHLYRTELIAEAINLIPDSRQSLRPETDMLNNMVENGYSWQQFELIVGLHDFEQYYTDIFRKSMIQAHKHKSMIHELFIKWENLKNDDFDFQIAIWGALYGSLYKNIEIDKNFGLNKIKDILKLQNISEKKNIENLDILNLNNQFDNNYSEELQTYIYPEKRWNEIHYKTNLNDFKNSSKKSKENLLYKTGGFIELLGKKIQTFSRRF